MLDVLGVMALLAKGEKIPQQSLRSIPDDEIVQLQQEAGRLLNGMLLALPCGLLEEEDAAVSRRVSELMDVHGWFETAMLFGLPLAGRCGSFDLSVLPPADNQDAGILALAFSEAARQDQEQEGIWTIPLAMLGSSDRETAQEFTQRMLYAAAASVLSRARTE